MIKRFLLLIIFFTSIRLDARIIDNFDRAVPLSFYSTEVGAGGGTLSLSYSDIEKVEGTGSMKITLDIPKYNNWAGWNAIYHYYGKNALQDWSSEDKYFLFDLKAVTKSTDVRVILNIKDNDEEWQSQRAISTNGKWNQYVFPIKIASGSNPDYDLNTDGFYRPSWITPGNNIINLNTIYGFLINFTSPNSIRGDFYIDNFRIVNDFELTVPYSMSIVNKDINKIKIFLGPKIIGNSVTNITINGTSMNSTYDSSLNAIICDLPYALNDNTVYTVSIPATIKIDTTFPLYLSSYSFQFKTGDIFSLTSSSLYRTFQLSDGTSLTVPITSFSNSETIFQIIRLTSYYLPTFNDRLKSINRIYRFTPENIQFNSPVIIRIFYENSEVTDESKLRLYRATENGWQLVSATIYPIGNYIEAKVNSLGVFAIMEDDFSSVVSLGQFEGLSSNPFTPNNDGYNDILKLYYSIYKDGCTVFLKILSADGRVVKSLLYNEIKNKGAYVVKWDGKSEAGEFLPTGFYFYELRIVDSNDLNNSQIFHGGIYLLRE